MLKRLGIEWNELISRPISSMMSFVGIPASKLFLGISIGIISATPIVAGALVLSYTPDIEYVSYIPSQELLEEEVSETVGDLLVGVLQFDLSEERLNQLIHSFIVEEINPSYDPISGCIDDDCQFVSVESFGVSLGINAVWVTLQDDQFVVNVALTELATGRTVVARLEFLLIDNAEEFEIRFSRLQTGFLPLPLNFFVNLVAPILESNGVSLTSDGTSALTYSLTDLNIRIDKQALIVESITNETLVSYASLIVEEEIVQITINAEEKEVRLFVDQERLYSQTSVPLIPGIVEFITALYLEELIESGTFSIGDLFN